MSPLFAISQGLIFGIGSVVFIAVVTAALSLAYLRFDELGDDQRDP
jgi:ABC-type transport system involved in multi-copper enzyme maturation permease subunit